MDRVRFASSAVISAGYDAGAQHLEIEFSSGRVYLFEQVPKAVYEWLLRAPNKGVYVTRMINPNYAYRDVTAPAPEPIDLAAALEASLAKARAPGTDSTT